MNRTGAGLVSVLTAGIFAATVWAQNSPEPVLRGAPVPPGAPIPPGAIVHGNKIIVAEPAKLNESECSAVTGPGMTSRRAIPK